MRTLRAWLGWQRLQYALGAAMLLLLILFLVRSNQTGRAEYEAAEDMLARIEALDLELDSVLFPLMFELQTSLDELTELQTELYEAAAAYDAEYGHGAQTALFERVKEKVAAIDEFKSQQAVMRNSRAIAGEMLGELLRHPDIAAAGSEELVRTVESAYYDFIGRRDPASISRLRARIADAERSTPVLSGLEPWQTFVAHADASMVYSEKLGSLMIELFGVPLPQQIAAELEALEAWFAERSRTASSYRFGMFAMALMLLGFSAYKVVQTRRYYRLIEHANNELEARVAERTSELSEANRALQTEIRERVSVESQLRIAQKLESIGQLAAGIAHEVNTPTQYVSDNLAFLTTAWQDLGPLLDDYERAMTRGSLDPDRGLAIWRRADVEYLREEVPAALGAATAGLDQIGRIVRAIKDFSHPGGDTLQPADINHAIENAATVARNEWKYVADLSLDLDPALPPVPCNISAFNQVILNLIVNAAQAIESASSEAESGTLGKIIVSTRLADDWVEIVVEDDGPGVPESIRDQVFDPFFTTKEVGKGTGQGLAIAFRVITKQHGGTIELDPPADRRGARFTVRLPLTRAEGGERPLGEDIDLTDTMRTLQLHARA